MTQQNQPKQTDSALEQTLQELFGNQAHCSPLSTPMRMGRRVHGIDLKETLSGAQAGLLQTLLDQFNILSFPDQGTETFRLGHLERLANHFGAPIPHPKNFANYIEHMRNGDTLELLPKERQTASLCDRAFPGVIKCIKDADSPAVYVVTNLPKSGPTAIEETASGLHWHTDIEFEPVPLSTSMFYVQYVPTSRQSDTGAWVNDVQPKPDFYHPESDPILNARRLALPLNGETAYADTAQAFSDLPSEQQIELEKIMVRRRVRLSDPGWLAPLVHINPRNGRKSLHSPVWASRGKNIAPVEVEDLSEQESRAFLDKLEAHVLQPKYRYDHIHQPGDVTIWSNFSTLHNAPPVKSVINSPKDARLMYRISCKGEPCQQLPREDSQDWLEKNVSPIYQSKLD